MGRMKSPVQLQNEMMDFESCRFDFRIDSKNGLTPSKRKKAERKGVNSFTLFKCKVCGSLFDSRPSLLEHKMTHNKYKCVFCEARFARQTWMMDHVALVHGMGEVSSKRKRKTSNSAPRKLLPKPVDDIDIGTATVISESDSGSPSPLSSPLQPIECPSPMMPMSGGVSPGSMIDLPITPKLPDLLPMSLSLPLPLTPQSMSISPLAFNSTSPATQGLTTPTLLSPPQLVPAFPQGPTAHMPQFLPFTNQNSAPDVPCIYINVPILLSSGDSSVNITQAQPLISTPMMTSGTTTVCSREPTPLPVSSLLPVNPFIRKDIPPVTQIAVKAEPMPFLVRPGDSTLEPGEVNPRFIPDIKTISTRFPNASISSEHSRPVTLEAPVPGPLHHPSPVMLMSNTQHDQTEALDFSVKPTTSVQSLTKPKENGSKQLFSTGIKDPSWTLCGGDMDTVVDLSQRPHSVPSPDRGINDDKLAMLQEYNESNVSAGRSSAQTDNEAGPSKMTKPATKRNKFVLDKMVQKLWKSKMTESKDGTEEADVRNLDYKSDSGRVEPSIDPAKVYVLNELPEQVGTFIPHGKRRRLLDDKRSRESSHQVGSNKAFRGYNQIPDTVLQSTAASIADAVMGVPKPEPIEQPNEQGFCSIKFHTCRVCKQLFYSAEEMWEHAVTHESFHKYKCNQCTYVTACHRELVNHKQATHGHDMQKDGRHICTYPGCMRSYSEWRYLRDHQKSHHQAEEKPNHYVSPPDSQAGSPGKGGRLICDFPGCFKTFKEWRHLKVHQTLHTGEKPLSCQLCSYACRHRSSMNWHMKSKHGLDKMKTQGNRTVYVDSKRRVVCGWSDEANREVNYLRKLDRSQQSDIDSKDFIREPDDLKSISEYSSFMDESRPASADNAQFMVHQDPKLSLGQMDGSTSVSIASSRPPSCAPSENPSERSLMDDPHMLMLKMQAKPTEFPLNMSVQIENLSPREQMVGEDGRFTSKMSDMSDKVSDKLTIDTSQDDCNFGGPSSISSPALTTSTVSSSVSSSEASSMVKSESNRLVMTPVACANLGQGSEHESSIMKFKLKYLVAPKFYPCKVCNENFDSASKMWEHRIEMHRDSTRFFCDNCGFDSPSMQTLQSHMMSTHGKEMGGKKAFVCFICGKGYATKTGLNQHLLRHSEDGPPQYECPYENCVSKVHSKCALKNHIRRVHLKVPPKYRCPEEGCQRRFESSSALSNHSVLHTDQRPLICNYPGCDKSFRETKHLKVHRMQHTDEKPIKCDACDYSCRQRNSMNWHMKSKHQRVKSVSVDGKTIYVPIMN